MKGEFVGTDWRVGALTRGVHHSPVLLIPAFWEVGVILLGFCSFYGSAQIWVLIVNVQEF